MFERNTQIVFRGEVRRITNIIKNTAGKNVILWEVPGKKSAEGACTPSLWAEWTKGERTKKKTS